MVRWRDGVRCANIREEEETGLEKNSGGERERPLARAKTVRERPAGTTVAGERMPKTTRTTNCCGTERTLRPRFE